MSYKMVNSDFLNSTWLIISQPDEVQQLLRSSFETLGSFSPSTNWEKVFKLGDKINKELKLSEKDIVDEINKLRSRKK
ncbi:hypothetical protein A3B45_02060 [Candidatus Daviesbacteria bacterium RIFCSPLOWO2_01_FULL_39_12]|uniref:Uncharacterized protein n=1 Tax=Candidatus Daviesbacteria bacterium RIFCSPLOWO2_01_FULL_39_12 TaxID=1797785 RepID=A0A1F5KM28_9BACT|nr:MAG: hypothetical protein A3D79_03075 [Candidatus Daviesbacteria bacterium RIFCSPHIGHO2_02_FULL_39_8]OGE41986.1 MAG: hypothetical protein A3B45_02060 [Candidatus Daviesbacteria bacterium RIFCSPLOWO2_01_FULL_39_12]